MTYPQRDDTEAIEAAAVAIAIRRAWKQDPQPEIRDDDRQAAILVVEALRSLGWRPRDEDHLIFLLREARPYVTAHESDPQHVTISIDEVIGR